MTQTKDPQMPAGVGIIMDGNGRWARRRGSLRTAGHRAGMAAVRRAIEYAASRGVSRLVLYAFSSENWKRPKTEVDAIMGLVEEFLIRETPELHEKGVRLVFLGERDGIPEASLAQMDRSAALTSSNTGLKVAIALNYGSRRELARAAGRLAAMAKSGFIDPAKITEDDLADCLYDPDFGDLDLIIRCGGEARLSNFMLWQSAYAEIFFCGVLWPDFSDADFDAAVMSFQSRSRRFGAIS